VKLPVLSANGSLCDQCVALCCRYYAFEIDKPQARRDFDDLRWYLLHEDCLIFVEDGDWYIQVNRKCRELLPDNRCNIYENRPAICREYTTKGCDWHADEYDYDQLFTEPEQIMAFAKEYLARKRKRRAAAGKTVARKTEAKKSASPRRRRTARKGIPLHLLKTA
jgi:uncharacterized protein